MRRHTRVIVVRAGLVLFLCGGVLAGGLHAQQPLLAARDISAPASDIISGVVAPPAPFEMHSTHAMIRLTRDLAAPFAVTVPGRVAIAVIVPPGELAAWKVEIRAPDGTRVVDGDATSDRAGRVAVSNGDIGALFGDGLEWNVRRFDIDARMLGSWSVRCVGIAAEAQGPCVALIEDAHNVALAAQWQSFRFVSGNPIAMNVSWRAHDALVLDASHVDAAVIGPNGMALPVDIAAQGDHVVVTATPTEAGRHTLTIQATTIALNGAPIVRTIETLIDVAASGLQLTGGVARIASDAASETLEFAMTGTADSVVLAAEVWTADTTDPVPVCWLATIAPLVGNELSKSAALAFDRRWLRVAGVREGTSLELRHVRVHDRRTWGVVDMIDAMPLGPAVLPPNDAVVDIDAMERGRAGGHSAPMTISELPPADDAAPGNHALLIVHGYCSGGVTFPPSAFTGPVGVFLDINQAKSNDAFAQTLLAYGKQYKSYGVAAHSQGGLASLHLYTFYWSGLDWAKPNATGGSRLIQSVGSPYQGTPLAGNLAILGQIFGTGCGSVTDLSPAGATIWLSTIPTWARQKVWYWTTSFFDGPGFDYCNIVSDFFLTDPDDGVVEKFRGQLPSANNMGHTTGWCHVEGMADPPQCTDATRNAQINAQAAR